MFTLCIYIIFILNNTNIYIPHVTKPEDLLSLPSKIVNINEETTLPSQVVKPKSILDDLNFDNNAPVISPSPSMKSIIPNKMKYTNLSNTNLSKVDTRVFDRICKFKNVHWTVSIETIEDEFEYIRYGGNWQDFLDNLNQINKLGHKISFNMLWFLLNYDSVFDCVDYFKGLGFYHSKVSHLFNIC